MSCCRSNKQKDKSLSFAKKQKHKVVLLGESGVGKSSIMFRYIHDEFSDNYDVTIGGSFAQKEVQLSNGQKIQLNIWDTAGQERFRSLMSIYYKESSAAMIVYDVSNPDSFDLCQFWVNQLRDQVPDCILYLVGNKSDLQHLVEQSRITEFISSNGMQSICVSAKTNENIDALFEMIGEALLKK